MCNSIRQRAILNLNDLSTYCIEEHTLDDLKALVYKAGGLLHICAQIKYLGGQPMPIPSELEERLAHYMDPDPIKVSEEHCLTLGPFTKPNIQEQEFASMSYIGEQFNLKSGMESHPLNVYLRNHYEAMARLYDKVLSRRRRQFLIPASYNQRTKELAAKLKAMKEAAWECIHQIEKEGLQAFRLPNEFCKVNGIPLLDVLCLFDED